MPRRGTSRGSHDERKLTSDVARKTSKITPDGSIHEKTPEHKRAIRTVISIANKYSVTGRGRVAPEGLNCTLTGSPAGIRSFCNDLRGWDELFRETDFKITDGVDLGKMFRQLSIRKTDELVAYGLAGGESSASEKRK